MAYQVTDLTTVGQAKALAQKVKAGLDKKANLVANLVAAGDLVMLTANGDIADSGIAQTAVMLTVASAQAGAIPTFGAGGQLTAGINVAPDNEFTEMLDEVFGTAA